MSRSVSTTSPRAEPSRRLTRGLLEMGGSTTAGASVDLDHRCRPGHAGGRLFAGRLGRTMLGPNRRRDLVGMPVAGPRPFRPGWRSWRRKAQAPRDSHPWRRNDPGGATGTSDPHAHVFRDPTLTERRRMSAATRHQNSNSVTIWHRVESALYRWESRCWARPEQWPTPGNALNEIHVYFGNAHVGGDLLVVGNESTVSSGLSTRKPPAANSNGGIGEVLIPFVDVADSQTRRLAGLRVPCPSELLMFAASAPANNDWGIEQVEGGVRRHARRSNRDTPEFSAPEPETATTRQAPTTAVARPWIPV